MARLRPDQLNAALKQSLAPIYLVTGDEPLLAQECCDAILAKARQQGFSERETHHTDAGFSWDSLMHSANSMSLFAEKKLIEIRVHNGKPGDAGSRALQEYCAAPSSDNLLLLIFPKLDKSAQSSKWFKALDKTASIITIWPIGPQQLPRWVDQRLKASGLNANSEAIEILCSKVEGNLLAATQEIEKLKLIVEGNVINAETMSSCVMESARYDVFTLVDRALYGDAAAVIRTLQGLRNEGLEAPVILWALAREVRTLTHIQEQISQGESFDLATKRNGIWDKRKPLVKQALRRLSLETLYHLLQLCSTADASIKGAIKHCSWQLLQDIALELSGNRALPQKIQQRIAHPF